MDIHKHTDKWAQQLSGGMKRRLSTGIAIIGSPEVIVLDEPSAGLDPLARRQLWNALLRSMHSRSVILTTHCMDEAEVLCGRVGVVVRGQMCCLGTSQHLKNKFGRGYEVSIRMRSDDVEAVSGVILGFSQHFPDVSVLERHVHSTTLLLPRSSMDFARVFSVLEHLSSRFSISYYGLNQSSLEQIFLDLAADPSSQPPEDDEEAGEFVM